MAYVIYPYGSPMESKPYKGICIHTRTIYKNGYIIAKGNIIEGIEARD